MKTTNKLIIFVFTFLALATTALAQSPREQLHQMVQQLQKNPNDNALREKIIKLGTRIRPVPAVPDTAIAFEGRARFAFESARSEADFLVAAAEYEKAVAAAPWVPGYYSDLCTIYQKAGKYEDAKRHCGFYLIGLADPTQMTEVKRRIAGLEFGIEKAALLRNKQAEKLRTTEGIWQLHTVDGRQIDVRWNGRVYEVTQQDGRFNVRGIGAGPACDRNLTAAATTIGWTEGTMRMEADVSCHFRAGYTVQCHLRDGSKLVCQKKGFSYGQAKPEWDSEVQMIRRTSCKNFQYVRDRQHSADCE